ncbi:MAG: hypothetical protein GY864_02365 [Desulfobacterales bacterium]|nr:hypothetical protein [Desulfobacterales bacterium]
MAGKGFKKVYNLKGGIKAWQGLKTAGPPEIGMEFFTGDETDSEVISLAYAMEKGAGEFYRIMADRTDSADVSSLFTKLAGIEDKHKQRLFDVYITISSEGVDRVQFEADLVPDVMEGGITVDEYLEKNKDYFETMHEVLDMAMMLETQAMDLYMRYSDKAEDEKNKDILYDIAEEEKAHLSALGRLMDNLA